MNYINNIFNNLYNIIPVFTNKIINNRFDKNRPSIYVSNKLDSFSCFFSNANLIIDNIYLGSMYNASDNIFLDEVGINSIVNITADVPNFYEDKISYFNIRIADNGEDILTGDYLRASYKFIDDNKNKPVLIHCAFGRSRSVSVLVYYLVNKYMMTVDEALLYIKSKRPYINPSRLLIDNVSDILSNV